MKSTRPRNIIGLQIGDIVTSSAVKPITSGFLVADNSVYLQSAYPKLFDILGLPEYAPNTLMEEPDDIPPGAPLGSGPFVTLYKNVANKYEKLADPAILPPGSSTGCSFSSDGVYLTVTSSAPDYITNYERAGDVYTKLTAPASLPAGAASASAYSDDGAYMAV